MTEEQVIPCDENVKVNVQTIGLFSSRKTLQEAQEYMMDVIEAMPSADRLPIMTGFYVFWNTLSLHYNVTTKTKEEEKDNG
jgi:hypothetical protein